jgi:hypothetical protein
MPDPIADDWTQPERLSPAERLEAEALIVDVDGFEGPLDLLLMPRAPRRSICAAFRSCNWPNNIWPSSIAGRGRCGSSWRPIIW